MPKNKVRWGLLSTARINRRLIPCMHASDRCQLLGVASRDQDRAQQYANQWEIPRAYGSYEQMLADPEIDAVYISLPNAMHAEWSIRCADAGKHVLCEKPLAISTEEVDSMSEAARRNNVIIQEATMMRFHAQTRYMRELIASGTIGDVRLIRGIFTFILDNPTDIRLDPNQGGGSIWDLGSYCVSFSRAVLNAEPVEVLASQVSSSRGVDLSLSGQMRFDGDIHAQFFSSFQSFQNLEADVFGTEGRIQLSFPWLNQIDRPAHVSCLHHNSSQKKSVSDDGKMSQKTDTKTFTNVNAYQDELDSMNASILDGTDPVISLADSRRNVAAILALLESAKTGKAIAQ